jgi:hypothetical protein
MADLAGYYPNNPAPQSIDLSVVTPSSVTNSLSGKSFRVAYGAQFYEANLKYTNMKLRDMRPLQGFMAQAFGPTFSFEVVFPRISFSTSANPPSTTVRTTGAISKGVKSVSLTNCGASKEVLNGGDYFKFDNHSKVYQATNQCLSNGSGDATLFFAGSLVNDVPDGTDLTISAVPFTMIFDGNNQSASTGVGGISKFNVKMREVW